MGRALFPGAMIPILKAREERAREGDKEQSVRRMGIAAIAVIVGSIVTVAGAYAGGRGEGQGTGGAAAPSQTVETERLTFEELAISVAVPTNWSVSVTGPDELTLFSAPSDEDDDFLENIEFRLYPSLGLLDNDRFSREAVRGFEQLPGYRELSQGTATVGGRSARSVHFMAESEDGVVEILAYFFVQNDAAMSIMAGAPTETFDAYEPLFRRIVRSIEQEAPPRNPAGLRVRTYTIDEYGMSIRLPMIWNVGSSGPFELYAIAPKLSEDDTFDENFAIDAVEIDEGTELDEFALARATEMAQLEGFEEVGRGVVLVAGEEANYLIGEVEQGGVTGRVLAAFWIHDGVGYSAAGWATAETFEEYLPQFEHALATVGYGEDDEE